MQDKRRHKRYKVNLVEINGRMSLADKVEIVDISLGGIAIRADRRLNIGREYIIKLQEKGRKIDVRGTVVRSELSGMEERAGGERVLIYAAGIMFKEGQTGVIADFIKSIEQKDKTAGKAKSDRRLNVRFRITAPRENILSYPAQFRVKKISLGGMLIETDQDLVPESRVPMELSLNADSTVTFIGRVASSRKTAQEGQAMYEIGVEFTDTKDQDKALIAAFVDYLAAAEREAGGQAGA